MDRFLMDAPLGRYCTFLAGGRAKRLAFCYTADELRTAADEGARILGRGSNVLVGDAGVAGLVAVNRTESFSFTETECVCDSGVLTSVLARAYRDNGRTGMEWAYGLPGSVGGAAAGNAGAFGGDMASAVLGVTVRIGGAERELTPAECGFAYRHSEIAGAILRVRLRAEAGDADAIESACKINAAARKRKQPQGASAGSVFRAVTAATGETVPAGWLLERAGCKGMRAGGAEISEKHANFIINRGGASAADILQLMNTAQAKVFDAFGIRLEREIKLLGDFF